MQLSGRALLNRPKLFGTPVLKAHFLDTSIRKGCWFGILAPCHAIYPRALRPILVTSHVDSG